MQTVNYCQPLARGAQPDVQHGIDVTQTTSAAMKPATVNCQVGAALLMRAHCAAASADREKALRALHVLVDQLCRDTVEHLKCVAWGLPDRTRKVPKERSQRLVDLPPSREEVREAAAAASQVEVARTPQHLVAISLTSDNPPETDLNSLTKHIEEKQHAHLCQGTKRALLGGGGAFNGSLTQQRNDPHLTLAGGAWVLFALADSSGRLEEWGSEEGSSSVL